MTYIAPLAAAVAASRRRVLRSLRDQGAGAPHAAAAYAPQSRLDTRVLRRLLRRGLVHEAAPGRYWVDEEAVATHRRRAVRSAATAAATLAVLGAAAALGALLL